MQYLIIMILVNNFNDGETCYKGGGGHRAGQEHGNVNPPPTRGYLEIFPLGLEGVHLLPSFTY